MTYDEIKAAWNVQADENNQWDTMNEDEKVEWAFSLDLYQLQPVAWYVTGRCTLLDEHEAKAEAKRCGGSAKAVPLYTK